MNKLVKRLTSLVMAGTFFITQAGPLPSASAQPGLHDVPEVAARVPLSLSLPPELGTIEALISGSGPTVVHIQEAHGNLEGQKQIRAILHYLKERYGFDLLLLEGNATRLEPELIRYLPDDPEQTLAILESLAKKNIISGPELFLAAEKEADAYGIEDLDAYVDNRRSFKEVLIARQRSRDFVARMDVQIERLSNPYLNKKLRGFLKQKNKFEDGLISFEDWLAFLREQAERHLDLDLGSPANQIEWPMLLRIFTLQRFEEALDRGRFPAERKNFLAALRRYLPDTALYGEIKSLLHAPLSRQRLPDPETELLFERMVSRLPRRFNYRAFPNVNLFIGHLILQSELKGAALVRETERLAGEISGVLAGTEKEREIVRLGRDYRLLKALLALELTSSEFDQLLERQESLQPGRLVARFLDVNDEERVKDSDFFYLSEIQELFEKAVAFYRGARHRDRLMLERVVRRMEETGRKKAVVITGGFHRMPFMRYFKEHGFNYALITPRMNELNGREGYVRNVLQTFFEPPRVPVSTLRDISFGATSIPDILRHTGNPVPVAAIVASTYYAERTARGADRQTVQREINALPWLQPLNVRLHVRPVTQAGLGRGFEVRFDDKSARVPLQPLFVSNGGEVFGFNPADFQAILSAVARKEKREQEPFQGELAHPVSPGNKKGLKLRGLSTFRVLPNESASSPLFRSEARVTEVRSARETLEANRQRIEQGITDGASLPIVTVDAEGKALYRLGPGRAARVIDYRQDRKRQLMQALQPGFDKFEVPREWQEALIVGTGRYIQAMGRDRFLIPNILYSDSLPEVYHQNHRPFFWGFSREKTQFRPKAAGNYTELFPNESMEYGRVRMPLKMRSVRIFRADVTVVVKFVQDFIKKILYAFHTAFGWKWAKGLNDRIHWIQTNEEIQNQAYWQYPALSMLRVSQGIAEAIREHAAEGMGAFVNLDAGDLNTHVAATHLNDMATLYVEQPDGTYHTVQGNGFDSLLYTAQALDRALRTILEALREVGGAAVLMPDHGSLDDASRPGHTGSDVPAWVVDFEDERIGKIGEPVQGGRIRSLSYQKALQSNAAPTHLELAGITPPATMTGESFLIEGYAPRNARRPVVTILLDGYGLGDPGNPLNMVEQARRRGLTPTLEWLYHNFQTARVPTSGYTAGLRGGREKDYPPDQLKNRKQALEYLRRKAEEKPRIRFVEVYDEFTTGLPKRVRRMREPLSYGEGIRELEKSPFLNGRWFVVGEDPGSQTVMIEYGDPQQIGSTEFNTAVIGDGRVIAQDVSRLDEAIRSGEFFNTEKNPAYRLVLEKFKKQGYAHFIGTLQESVVGVHASLRHLYHEIDFLKRQGVTTFMFDFALDGRDEGKFDSQKRLRELADAMEYFGITDYYINTFSRDLFDRAQKWGKTEELLHLLFRGRRTESRQWVWLLEEDGSAGVLWRSLYSQTDSGSPFFLDYFLMRPTDPEQIEHVVRHVMLWQIDRPGFPQNRLQIIREVYHWNSQTREFVKNPAQQRMIEIDLSQHTDEEDAYVVMVDEVSEILDVEEPAGKARMSRWFKIWFNEEDGTLLIQRLVPSGADSGPMQIVKTQDGLSEDARNESRAGSPDEIGWGVDPEWLEENRTRIVPIFISGGEGPGVNDYFEQVALQLLQRGRIPVAVQNGIQGFIGGNLASRLMVLNEERLVRFRFRGGVIPGTSRVNLLAPKMKHELAQAIENMKGFGAYLAIGGGDHAIFWTRFAKAVKTIEGLSPAQRQAAQDIVSKMLVVYKTIDGDTHGVPLGFYTAAMNAQTVVYSAASSHAARGIISTMGIMGADTGMLAVEAASRLPINRSYLEASRLPGNKGKLDNILANRGNVLSLIPEVPVSLEQVVLAVRDAYQQYGTATILVSEGFKIAPDDPVLHKLIFKSPYTYLGKILNYRWIGLLEAAGRRFSALEPLSVTIARLREWAAEHNFYDRRAASVWQDFLEAPRDPHGNLKRSGLLPHVIVAAAINKFFHSRDFSRVIKPPQVRLEEKISYGTLRGRNAKFFDRILAGLLARKIGRLVDEGAYRKVVSMRYGDLPRIIRAVVSRLGGDFRDFDEIEREVIDELSAQDIIRAEDFDAVFRKVEEFGLYHSLFHYTPQELAERGVVVPPDFKDPYAEKREAYRRRSEARFQKVTNRMGHFLKRRLLLAGFLAAAFAVGYLAHRNLTHFVQGTGPELSLAEIRIVHGRLLGIHVEDESLPQALRDWPLREAIVLGLKAAGPVRRNSIEKITVRSAAAKGANSVLITIQSYPNSAVTPPFEEIVLPYTESGSFEPGDLVAVSSMISGGRYQQARGLRRGIAALLTLPFLAVFAAMVYWLLLSVRGSGSFRNTGDQSRKDISKLRAIRQKRLAEEEGYSAYDPRAEARGQSFQPQQPETSSQEEAMAMIRKASAAYRIAREAGLNRRSFKSQTQRFEFISRQLRKALSHADAARAAAASPEPDKLVPKLMRGLVTVYLSIAVQYAHNKQPEEGNAALGEAIRLFRVFGFRIPELQGAVENDFAEYFRIAVTKQIRHRHLKKADKIIKRAVRMQRENSDVISQETLAKVQALSRKKPQPQSTPAPIAAASVSRKKAGVIAAGLSRKFGRAKIAARIAAFRDAEAFDAFLEAELAQSGMTLAELRSIGGHAVEKFLEQVRTLRRQFAEGSGKAPEEISRETEGEDRVRRPVLPEDLGAPMALKRGRPHGRKTRYDDASGGVGKRVKSERRKKVTETFNVFKDAVRAEDARALAAVFDEVARRLYRWDTHGNYDKVVPYLRDFRRAEKILAREPMPEFRAEKRRADRRGELRRKIERMRLNAGREPEGMAWEDALLSPAELTIALAYLGLLIPYHRMTAIEGKRLRQAVEQTLRAAGVVTKKQSDLVVLPPQVVSFLSSLTHLGRMVKSEQTGEEPGLLIDARVSLPEIRDTIAFLPVLIKRPLVKHILLIVTTDAEASAFRDELRKAARARLGIELKNIKNFKIRAVPDKERLRLAAQKFVSQEQVNAVMISETEATAREMGYVRNVIRIYARKPAHHNAALLIAAELLKSLDEFTLDRMIHIQRAENLLSRARWHDLVAEMQRFRVFLQAA